MIERKIAVKLATADDAGTFAARVYVVGGMPDGDRDVILAVPPAGHKVLVSLGEHDAVLAGAEPAGEAALFEVGGSVIAHGRAHDSQRGAALRTKLLEGGPDIYWSIGFPTTPDQGFKSRKPTPAELKQWPDARRMITAWSPIEISPVRQGSCGPACRTLSAKCAGGCSCEARSEREAIVAESRRILAEGAKLLASSKPPALSPAELHSRLTEAQWRLGVTPEVRVDDERHHAAKKAAAWAAAQWGVREPQVKFYSRNSVPDPMTRGFFDERDSGSIWLRSDLKSWDLCSTLMHEASHHARYHIGRGLTQDENEVVLDAHHLVRRYVAEVVDVQ